MTPEDFTHCIHLITSPLDIIFPLYAHYAYLFGYRSSTFSNAPPALFFLLQVTRDIMLQRLVTEARLGI